MNDDQSYMSAKPSCAKCGADPETEANPTDSSRLICPKCKADLGSYGDLRLAVVDAARKKAVHIANDILKKR